MVRENSGGANGLTFDLQGRVIMCDGDDRQITRWEHDGSITVIADSWEGKRLHRPNDVVCRSDGSIYFTNPGLRLPPEEREIDFHGIHRIAPDGTVTAVITDLESPNGLTFSPGRIDPVRRQHAAGRRVRGREGTGRGLHAPVHPGLRRGGRRVGEQQPDVRRDALGGGRRTRWDEG